jgi:hypothetical protein
LTAGQLHAVAAVACKSDYHRIRKGGLPLVGFVHYRCRHFIFCLESCEPVTLA